MKIYLHYDNKGDPAFTMVVLWNETKTGSVKELVQLFCRSYNNFHGSRIKLQADHLMLASEERKPFLPDSEVASIAKDKADFYVIPLVCETANHLNSLPSSPNCSDNIQIKKLLIEAQKLYIIRDKAEIYENILQLNSKHRKAMLNLGEIYLKADRPAKALIYFEKVLEYYPDTPDIHWWIGDCYLNMKNGNEAYENYLKCLHKLEKKSLHVSRNKYHNLQVCLSKALALQGNQDAAVSLVRNVALENRNNLEALMHFAMLTYSKGPLEASDAMIILLTVLLQRKGDKTVQKNFTTLCQIPDGLQNLEKSSSKEAWNSAVSLSFFAVILRDNGALEQAIALIKRAYEIDPHTPHYILCYVHMLEVEEKHDDVFNVIVNYLKSYPDKKIGGFQCSLLLPFLTNINKSIYLYDEQLSLISYLPEVEKVSCLSLPENELRLLALLFTLVKILFIKGALCLLPSIIKTLDPLHSNQDLHKTLIRNEAAYFACINQILATCFPKQCFTPKPRFIYFISDSHCISPAWQRINYKGEEYVLHPILSTGIKIWHLRPESVFYPKINLFNALKNIPPGAITIFAFGEIDCREGLLHSVEKCKYKNIAAAANSVIDIYIKLLSQLKEKYNFVINVHPVPPTLNVTRLFVNQFNELLEKRLKHHSEFHWLDFVDKLFTGSFCLNPKYEFDGIHLHPCYISLIEEALEKKSRYDVTDL